MASLTGTPIAADFDLYSVSTVKPGGYHIGDRVPGSNGSAFRLAMAGETLVVGKIYQGSVIDTQFNDMVTPTSHVAGTKTVTVTNGTTTVTANQFDGGILTISAGASNGIGETYTIIGHDADSRTSGQALHLVLDRPLRTAWLAGTTTVTLRRNTCSGVILAATTLTAGVAGVALVAATVGQFTWLQTWGEVGIYSDSSTFAAGSDVGLPGATAGMIGVNVAGTGKMNSVGVAMQANSSGKPVPIFMHLS